MMPAAIAFGPDGTLYVADEAAQIRTVSTAGAVATLAGGGETNASGMWVDGGDADGAAANARFDRPDGIAVGADGTVYVSDRDNQCIRTIAHGVVRTPRTRGLAALDLAGGSAIRKGAPDAVRAWVRERGGDGTQVLTADVERYLLAFRDHVAGNRARMTKLAWRLVCRGGFMLAPELFISYAHADNEYPRYASRDWEGSRGWVECFYHALSRRVQQLRRGTEIWRDGDGGICGASALTPAIEDGIAKASILVTINSPAYAGSDWCERELKLFLDSARERHGGLRVGTMMRVFRINKLPVSGDTFLNRVPELVDNVGYTFFRNLDGSPLEPIAFDADSILERSRHDAARRWKRLRRAWLRDYF